MANTNGKAEMHKLQEERDTAVEAQMGLLAERANLRGKMQRLQDELDTFKAYAASFDRERQESAKWDRHDLNEAIDERNKLANRLMEAETAALQTELTRGRQFERLSKKQQANKLRAWELERLLRENLEDIADRIQKEVSVLLDERQDMEKELDQIENQVPESVQDTWDDVDRFNVVANPLYSINADSFWTSRGRLKTMVKRLGFTNIY